MDDLCSGHGFLPQYNGPEVEHIIRSVSFWNNSCQQSFCLFHYLSIQLLIGQFISRGLRRNTSYRFKLRAHNEMGASQYSGLVS